MEKQQFQLATLTWTDLVEIWRARVMLRQTYEGIQASALQAKPALLGSIDQADDALVDLMKKCAKRAVRFAALGQFARLKQPQGLIDCLLELAPEEAAKAKARDAELARLAEEAAESRPGNGARK